MRLEESLGESPRSGYRTRGGTFGEQRTLEREGEQTLERVSRGSFPAGGGDVRRRRKDGNIMKGRQRKGGEQNLP